MNAISNKVQLVGTVSMEPVIMRLDDKPVVKFSMATVERVQRVNGESEHISSWWDIVGKGQKRADFASKYLCKGQKIAVEGSLRIRERKSLNGVVVQKIEIVASTIMLVRK